MSDQYVLTLTANNGETAKLIYETLIEAAQMKQAFMNTGDYHDAQIKQLES